MQMKKKRIQTQYWKTHMWQHLIKPEMHPI